MYYTSSTKKQIDFANKIAHTLDIDFPTYAAEYTKLALY